MFHQGAERRGRGSEGFGKCHHNKKVDAFPDEKWWRSQAKQAIVNADSFFLLQALLFSHFGGPRKLIFGMSPILTQLEGICKKTMNCFWLPMDVSSVF